MLSITNIQNGFGLDIGDRSIKLLRLEMKKTFLHKRKFIVKNYAEIGLPEGIIEQGEIKNESQVELALKSLLKEAGNLPSNAVVASLPETKTFLKVLEITAKKKKEIQEKIIEQLPKILPASLEEIYFDWQIVETKDIKPTSSDAKSKNRKAKKEKEKKYVVFLAAAPKTTVDNFLKILNGVNLTPIVLELEAVALARAMLGENKSQKNIKKSNLETRNRIIIDFGATQTSLTINKKDVPTMSINLPISGNQITDIIAKKLKIPFKKAETLKKQCGFDPRKCDNKLLPIVNLTIKDICGKIYKILKTYPELFKDKKMQPIILSGGGANMLKLDAVLSRGLKIKARRGTPLEIWNIESKNEKFNKSQLGASTVIGLALRAALYPFPNTTH